MKSIEVREKILALLCMTIIAVFAMLRLTDPENVVVNVIVAIGSFISGSASARRTDISPK